MKKVLTLVFAFAIWGRLAAEPNNSLSDDALQKIQFEQKLNSTVSAGLKFRDENGAQIQIGNYFNKRPVILMLGYYGCPMLCTLALNGAISTFQDLKGNVGERFDVIFVSIDPKETPQLAAAKKRPYMRSYGRGAAAGWHFLTGQTDSINQLADEIGFHFAYDAAIGQFAHPSGFVVLTPNGTISHYFFGINYSATELNAALRVAAEKKVGSPVEQFVLLCFHYSPLTGKYSQRVLGAVRLAGIVSLIGLGAIIFAQRARRKLEKPK